MNPDVDTEFVTLIVKRFMEILVTDGVYNDEGRLTPAYAKTERSSNMGFTTCSYFTEKGAVCDEENDDDLEPSEWHWPIEQCRKLNARELNEMAYEAKEYRHRASDGESSGQRSL